VNCIVKLMQRFWLVCLFLRTIGAKSKTEGRDYENSLHRLEYKSEQLKRATPIMELLMHVILFVVFDYRS